MSTPLLFDRNLLRKRRNHAAAFFSSVDFVKREACRMLAERLGDIARPLPRLLELGAHDGVLREYLTPLPEFFVQTELAPSFAHTLSHAIICDEEFLPFAENSFDAVVSVMSLHWVNDLPGTLAQTLRCLKPDGLFLAILPGATTLNELRTCLAEAEMELEGGISPRVAPFVEVRDGGNLLQRAGFALPMADATPLTITYAHPLQLLQDLQKMSETNMLLDRRKSPLRRETLMRAMELYRERFSDAEGRVVASVELLALTGWKPHPSQPKAAKRGSGQASLKDFLN